jgi:2,3-dihydroxy-p-cumate/2,3-dihydroxybenzoate 3,4-dioxygenase
MLRYSKLGYVSLNVSDVARSRQFYEEIVGLQYNRTTDDGRVAFDLGTEAPCQLILGAGSPGYRSSGWQLEAGADPAAARRWLEARGSTCTPIAPSEFVDPGIHEGFRVVHPSLGGALDIYVGSDAEPTFTPTVTQIQRLGHVVLATPHGKAAREFVTDALNFHESDSIGEFISFYRCFPNPFHHGFGISRGANFGLNHVNFMVSEVDDIGRAINRLKKNNVPIVFGPGRHLASGSVFLYFLDPDGMTLEYSFGMEEFPEVGARPARAIEPGPLSTDLWGGTPDARMGGGGAVERFPGFVEFQAA